VTNYNSEVSATAVAGALRHAPSGLGMFTHRSWLPTRNDAMRLAVVRTAAPAIVRVQATAKQAPQSRGSSAHT
jgi:hypothetical protein